MKPQRLVLRTEKGWRLPKTARSVAPPSMWAMPWGWVEDTFDRRTRLRLYYDMVRGFWSPSLMAAWSDAEFVAATNDRDEWLRVVGRHPLEAIRSFGGVDLACRCEIENRSGRREMCHADLLLVLANPETSFPWWPDVARRLDVVVR